MEGMVKGVLSLLLFGRLSLTTASATTTAVPLIFYYLFFPCQGHFSVADIAVSPPRNFHFDPISSCPDHLARDLASSLSELRTPLPFTHLNMRWHLSRASCYATKPSGHLGLLLPWQQCHHRLPVPTGEPRFTKA